MRWLFILVFWVFASVSVIGQNANAELATLRDHLLIPESTTLELADSPSLPSDTEIKVYIAMGLDMGVRNNFRKWITDWNNKNGKKYRMVEVVSDMQEANIILARYTVREKVTSETSTRTVAIPTTVYDPATKGTVTRPVPITTSRSHSLVPVYAYIILREPDKLEILSRYTGQADVQETSRSGEQLRDDFFKMIKKLKKSSDK